MNIIDLILSRRSIRRFLPKRIDLSILKQIVDAGRLAPSARNLQPLVFMIIDEPTLLEQIFPLTGWAGYLPPEQGRPPKGKEPVAYILVMIDRTIRKEGGGEDVGAAMENMILAALNEGIGSCWIGSIHRPQLRLLLNIPEQYDLAALLALGYPDEQPIIENMQNSIEYYRDEQGRLHVPKRNLDDILHYNTF